MSVIQGSGPATPVLDIISKAMFMTVSLGIIGLIAVLVFLFTDDMYRQGRAQAHPELSNVCQMHSDMARMGCDLVQSAKSGGHIDGVTTVVLANQEKLMCAPEMKGQGLNSETLHVVEAMGPRGGVVTAAHSVRGTFGGWLAEDLGLDLPIGSICYLQAVRT